MSIYFLFVMLCLLGFIFCNLFLSYTICILSIVFLKSGRLHRRSFPVATQQISLYCYDTAAVTRLHIVEMPQTTQSSQEFQTSDN